MGVNSLPKSVTRQLHDCDLNPGSSVPESSTLTTWLPSHSTITVTSFFQRVAYKKATKTVWHRYGTKLRYCHFMYIYAFVFPVDEAGGFMFLGCSGSVDRLEARCDFLVFHL